MTRNKLRFVRIVNVRVFIVAASMTILFAPIVAYVVGARGTPIENRTSVAFRGVEPGWEVFKEFGRYVADRLPLRSAAIRADAAIDENVFREDPAFGGGSSPRVIRGRDGFLFIADAIDNACGPHLTPEETVARFKALADAILESGRSVLTMIAPDKSSVHPELLPSDLARRDCFDQYTESLWGGLASARIPGYVDLRAKVVRKSSETREPLYFRMDSHWDAAGGLVAVQAAIERLQPGLWSEAEVNFGGLYDYYGDLTGLLGNPQVDQAPSYSVVRPDVQAVSNEPLDNVEGSFSRRFVNAAPPGRLIPGKTLLILDSYGLVALPNIAPFFEDLTVVGFVEFEPSKFISLIEQSDLVWLLCIERGLGWRMGYEIGTPDFVTDLSSSLTPRGSGS